MVNSDGVLYELGVDFDTSGVFVNGDVALASYDMNLVQSVMNRLNTDLCELDWFYYDYGSILTSFLGWKANDETLGFIRAELTNVLNTEPRLLGFNIDLSYLGDGRVKLDLVLYPSEDISIPLNLVLTTTGVIELETDEIINDEEE